MQNLLFLSAHLPSDQATEAGQKIAFKNLKLLSEKYYVHLVSFVNQTEKKWNVDHLYKICSSVHLINISNLQRLINIIQKPHWPLLVSSRWSRRAMKIIKTLNTKHSFDRVHCEWGRMAQYYPFIKNIPTRTLDIIDVLWQWSIRNKLNASFLKKIFWNVETKRTQKWEKKLYSNFTHIYTLSQKDIELLRVINPDLPKHCSITYPSFDSFTEKQFNSAMKLRKETIIDNPSIIFWGSLRRSENIEGALWLKDKVFPLIKNRFSKTQLTIMGANPPSQLKADLKLNLQITGYVENPYENFQKAHLALLPLFHGAGVKIKVLECLAAGIPVLTTDVGGEGIKASEEDGLFILPPTPTLFAEKVNFFLSNPEKLFQVSRHSYLWGLKNNVQNNESLLIPS